VKKVLLVLAVIVSGCTKTNEEREEIPNEFEPRDLIYLDCARDNYYGDPEYSRRLIALDRANNAMAVGLPASGSFPFFEMIVLNPDEWADRWRYLRTGFGSDQVNILETLNYYDSHEDMDLNESKWRLNRATLRLEEINQLWYYDPPRTYKCFVKDSFDGLKEVAEQTQKKQAAVDAKRRDSNKI